MSGPNTPIRKNMIFPQNASGAIFHLNDIKQSFVKEDIELHLQELGFMSPSPTDVKRLAGFADNLFIYAATVVWYTRLGKNGTNLHGRGRLTRMLSVDSESRKKFA
ncbi:hypothetical protein CTheo_8757 [Ceratobasidium theobromae]|uniref:Uncharacterized protein n=1 Tax=Ceratobasidium theobromae TaxID=1582974 RepID=A0A5N5Q8Q7_9AGAM|nr:hypothetical protein CTheo_8757 [Ceratobasidium theobromae]